MTVTEISKTSLSVQEVNKQHTNTYEQSIIYKNLRDDPCHNNPLFKGKWTSVESRATNESEF